MTMSKKTNPFRFKQFTIVQDRCKMKVGTDGVLLGAWVDVAGVHKVLDVGAGSGLIALMVAQRSVDASVTGVEIDLDSYEEAMQNIAASPWAERMEMLHESVQAHAEGHAGRYDLLVTNPPFFSGGTLSDQMGRNEVRHTVKLSHGDMLRAAQRLLSPQGRLALVLPYIEGLRFIELAATYHFYPHRLTEVVSRAGNPIERLLMELGRNEEVVKKESLTIHDESHETGWTAAYRALTRDFYLYL